MTDALPKLVLQRIFTGVVVIWGAVTLLFLVFHVLPGSGADAILAGDRIATDEQRLRVEQRLGLDRPLVDQYRTYMSNVIKGDLGESFVNGRPVSAMLGQAVPASLRLAFWAVALELVLGLGLAALTYRRKRLRFGASVLSVVGLALPVFVVGFGLQLVFGVLPARRHWPHWLHLPVQGIGADSWFLVIPSGDQWRWLVLPVATLAIASSAVLYRIAVPLLRAVADEPYVRGARLRGVSKRRVFVAHIVLGAAPVLVTFAAVDAVALFGSAVVTEAIFNWPGVGGMLATAITRRDTPVILAVTLVLAVAYVVMTTMSDIVQLVIDRRRQ